MIFCIGGLDLSRVSAIPQNPERSPDSVTSSVPRAAAWLLYQPSRLPRLEARAACGARVVRMRPAPALEALNLISLAMDTLNPIFIRMTHLRGALPTLAVALPL